MTKTELVANIAEDLDITRPLAAKALDSVMSNVTNLLVNGDAIVLRGFGKFYVKNRKARKARNPKSGKTINIPARKYPHFKPGRSLKRGGQ
ncbi:MAG: HU family DNA-binding protein [Desulfobacterales bacterium]|nr:HU family DNA-binding protein [Desulfobacterales bacterium]